MVGQRSSEGHRQWSQQALRHLGEAPAGSGGPGDGRGELFPKRCLMAGSVAPARRGSLGEDTTHGGSAGAHDSDGWCSTERCGPVDQRRPDAKRGVEQSAHATEKSDEREGKTDLATTPTHGRRWIGVTQHKWEAHVGLRIPRAARPGWWMAFLADGDGLGGAVGVLAGRALERLPGGGGPWACLEW
jgi:hypothetical protein